MEDNLILRVAMLNYFKCPLFNLKNYKKCKETKYSPYTDKEQLIETVPEETWTLDLLGNDFKSAI